MTASLKVLDPREIETTDAQASLFMHEGIRLMTSDNNAHAALVCFDRALGLRLRLPTELPMHAYGLAACWLNRAEALACLGPSYHALTLAAYDEALALLRPLPVNDDARFSKRLAIAHQNRALILAAENPLAKQNAIAALFDAIAVLDHAETMNAAEREYLLAAVWMNLATFQAAEATIVSDVAAQEAARRALALVKEQEHEDAAAAEIGLKARHVLCHIAARRLSVHTESEIIMAYVHDATDLSEDGLAIVRKWERRGVGRFRDLASDLFRFGARVYACFQPHFLREFLTEHLDARQAACLHPKP